VLLALSLLAFSLASHPAPAHAKEGDHGAGFGLGQVFLLGDFGTIASDSMGIGFSYSYEASDLFGLLTDVTFSSHSDAGGSNHVRIKGITPNLRINLAYMDKLVTYMFAGLGFFDVDQKVGPRDGGVTTLGFGMGLAFALTMSDHFQFGTRVSFHNIFSKADPSANLTIGGTYVGLSLTTMYIF
jgi:hypothetical protein